MVKSAIEEIAAKNSDLPAPLGCTKTLTLEKIKKCIEGMSQNCQVKFNNINNIITKAILFDREMKLKRKINSFGFESKKKLMKRKKPMRRNVMAHGKKKVGKKRKTGRF